MTERTYPEMVEELITMNKTTLNEIIPKYCFAGYIFGCLSKKQIKKFENENPHFFDFIRELINKEIEINSKKTCNKCQNKITINDKFCSNCGKWLGLNKLDSNKKNL